ncbi:MAG: DUF3575 domain-containing protein [Mediterranea massiliensis]|nr:DUF3575 domain-containing protein [Mediterranea massiliensis]
MDNADHLRRIKEYLAESPRIDSIIIRSYASPEGPYWLNKRYAEQRGEAVYDYLQNYMLQTRGQQLPDSLIHMKHTAENWEGLIEMVQSNYHRPDREQLIRLLHTRRIDDMHRKLEIQKLDDGRTWNHLLQHYMPQLRYATWIIVCCSEKAEVQQEEDVVEPEVVVTDSLVTPVEVDTIAVLQPVQLPVATDTADLLPEYEETNWAIKTNLLYDAALMPSVEVEYRCNPHWSLSLEGGIAWWRNKGKHKYYQLAHVAPEVRYWFRPDNRWKGHYVGAFLMGGLYDLQNHEGYQGEFAAAGISYGYMFPISRQLSLELGLGIGYLYTKYEEYLPEDGHSVYQQTSHTGYVGPVKGKVSLVWRIGQKKLDNVLHRLKGGKR